MKNTYYTIFALSHIVPLVEHAHDIAREVRKGKRNQLEEVPLMLTCLLYTGYHYSDKETTIGYCEPCWEKLPYTTDKIKRNDIIYRFNGKNLGCSRFTDYRQVLDVVTVDHVTKNSIIGTYGERVRAEQIICVARKDVKQNDT